MMDDSRFKMESPTVGVLAEVRKSGVVAVFNHLELDRATNIVGALSSAGISAFEFTNRHERALDTFRPLERWTRKHHPNCVLGVGSIVNSAAAMNYVDAGAEFVVGPGFVSEVASSCHRRGVPYVPGCGTVTEMLTASAAGCDVMKAFPASSLGGADFVRAVRGPCPWLNIMPTGGVETDESSLREMFDAGAFAVGLGSSLVRNDLVDKQDWLGLTEVGSTVAAVVRQLRTS